MMSQPKIIKTKLVTKMIINIPLINSLNALKLIWVKNKIPLLKSFKNSISLIMTSSLVKI